MAVVFLSSITCSSKHNGFKEESFSKESFDAGHQEPQRGISIMDYPNLLA